MKQAVYGRLDVFCPTCGSLNQRKISTLCFHDGKIFLTCIGCDEIFCLDLMSDEVEPEAVIVPVVCTLKSSDMPVVDDTPQEKIDDLAELTKTRVYPKSMSKRVKAETRARKNDN